MKIRINLCKDAVLLAGKDEYGLKVVDVPAANLTDEERQELVEHGEHGSDKAPVADYYLDRYQPVEVTEPTETAVKTVLAGFRQQKRDEEAKAKAKLEAARAATEQVLRSRNTTTNSVPLPEVGIRGGKLVVAEKDYLSGKEKYDRRGSFSCVTPNWPYYSDYSCQLKVSAVKESPEAVAWQAELDAQNEAAKAAALEKVKAEVWAAYESDQKAAAEKVQWIKSHGSNRLLRMVEEGIECESVYLDERLAHDFPGWRWMEKVPGDRHDPRNVPDEAWDILDEARKQAPDAELDYWTVDYEQDEDDYFDEDAPRYSWTGYVASVEFLGQWIVYGGPAAVEA